MHILGSGCLLIFNGENGWVVLANLLFCELSELIVLSIFTYERWAIITSWLFGVCAVGIILLVARVYTNLDSRTWGGCWPVGMLGRPESALMRRMYKDGRTTVIFSMHSELMRHHHSSIEGLFYFALIFGEHSVWFLRNLTLLSTFPKCLLLQILYSNSVHR